MSKKKKELKSWVVTAKFIVERDVVVEAETEEQARKEVEWGNWGYSDDKAEELGKILNVEENI